MTEALWRGSFGREYFERNRNAGVWRESFWRKLLGKHRVTSILEVGCGTGENLRHIVGLVKDVRAVDINAEVVREVRDEFQRRVAVRELSATDLDGLPAVEMVFSCGVLIHLDEEQLPRALDGMHALATRFVLVMEYEADEVVEVPYRDQVNALWKRPYGRIITERFSDLKAVDSGFLGSEDGFDDVTWTLLEKR